MSSRSPAAPRHWSAANTAEIEGILARERIEFVHVGIFDTEGAFREKRVPTALALRYVQDGWSFIDALPFWGPNDAVRADRAYRSEGCALDVDSIRPYPFEANAALIVADYTGDSAALSPRQLLAAQLKRASGLGFEVLGASEFEFIILDETPASASAKAYQDLATHAQENRCWSGLYPASGATFLREYDAFLRNADVPLHHLCAELGPGCLEAALPVRPLAAAADDAALFKLYTKAFCIERGLMASFMAQLSDAHPGLGGHPIISLRDRASGAASFHAAEDPQGISAHCRHFVAGVLHALPELMPMFAGTVNAYRRYVPGNWAPRTATWGIGNYTCALRVVNGAPDDCRVEFRLPGADTSAHLAFAMLLGAGLDGIERRLTPPPETRDIGRELVHADIGPLPRTLLEAAERMHASALARALFGDRFVDHYTQSCIQEDHLMRRHVSAFERARYLHHV
jgi:glutamine synthetase